jgi:hypothetical protein
MGNKTDSTTLHFRHKTMRSSQIVVAKRKLDVDKEGFISVPRNSDPPEFTPAEHVRMLSNTNIERTDLNSKSVLKERRATIERQLAQVRPEYEQACQVAEALGRKGALLESQLREIAEAEGRATSTLTSPEQGDEIDRLETLSLDRLKFLAKGYSVNPDGFGRVALIAAIRASAAAKAPVVNEPAPEPEPIPAPVVPEPIPAPVAPPAMPTSGKPHHHDAGKGKKS